MYFLVTNNRDDGDGKTDAGAESEDGKLFLFLP
jgi:hypothetical protein